MCEMAKASPIADLETANRESMMVILVSGAKSTHSLLPDAPREQSDMHRGSHAKPQGLAIHHHPCLEVSYLHTVQPIRGPY